MEFKLIDGFNGRYAVTSEGKVHSMILHGKGVSSTPVKELVLSNNKGYLRASLRRTKWDDPIEGKYVHRLVAEAFIPNPDGLQEVNHIDGNKQNNCVGNLEWVSRQENITHAWSTGLSTNEMNKGKGMTLYIGTCLTTGNKIQVESKAKLSELGYSPSCVIRVCNGDRVSHKNMTWEKVKSPERLANN